MLNHVAYRKFATLRSGKQLIFRCLNDQDWEGLVDLFQETPDDDAQFLRHDLKGRKAMNDWLDLLKYPSVIPLVAADPENKRLIGEADLHRGQGSAKHIGEIKQIFVSRPFQGQGVGSLMLEELIELAAKENLRWLKAEVVSDHKSAIKAFLGKGFKIKATLEDFFISRDGSTHDVVLMSRPVHNGDEEEDF
jgi:RimJ/RimL family protein N-acetyltransferase